MDPEAQNQQTEPQPINSQQNMMASSPNMGKVVIVSLGVLCLGLAIAYTGFYLGQRSISPSSRDLSSISPSVSLSPTTAATVSATPTISPIKPTYADISFGYTISYPTGWIFRRTYGPDIKKLAPTDILSGFDLTYNTIVNGQTTTQATIVMNMLDSHGYTDIEKWIDAYDLNYPKSATRSSISFHGYSALKYTDDTNPQSATEYIYFLTGKYAYRITYAESPVIRNATRDIVNSFRP